MSATREEIKVAVTWDFMQLVEPSYESYEVAWLREKTMRQLLAHVPICATCKSKREKMLSDTFFPIVIHS